MMGLDVSAAVGDDGESVIITVNGLPAHYNLRQASKLAKDLRGTGGVEFADSIEAAVRQCSASLALAACPV